MNKIICLVVLILVSGFYLITNNNGLANDYYDVINEKFLSHDYLGDDEYIYNTFVVAQDKSNEVRDDIVSDIVSGKIDIDNGTSDKIKILYSNILDYDTRNKIGLGSLDIYIDSIMNSKNIVELVDNSVVIENDLGIDIFTRVLVDNDFLDNSKNIVYFYPVTFAFGASGDYFVDEDYMAYEAYIKRAIINLLEKYGMSKSEARLVSSEIIEFYTNISGSSKFASSYEDITSYYNIVDKEYLSDVYSNIDIFDYLNSRGIKTKEFSLVDEGQYRKINEYLTDKYLLIWKKVILVKILSSYASYLDLEYRSIVVDLNNSLTGTNKNTSIEEEAINMVNGIFSGDIDKIFEKKVITDKDKKYLYGLFDDIKKCFRKMLKDNDWLSADTKDKALMKLDNMKIYVGIFGDSNTNIDLSGDNLIDNIISINKSSYLNSLERLEDNSDVRAISESEVNAYYNPMTNAVYVPSSVMFLLSDKDSYYEVLGTIGMILAHEITHGFDYNGSMFDSIGNLNNWWNDIDRANYTKLKNRVSEYYSKIEVLDGKYINGDKTVNENIADMGALKIITEVARKKNANDNELKVMYSSFAKFWKSQATENYTKLLLLNDSHSPNKYRVNAVLSLIDEFYDVYNIYPWNDMYVSSSNRIRVW